MVASDAESSTHLVGFAEALRKEGLAVPLTSFLGFAEAAAMVGFAERNRLYWAGRATLVITQRDISTYDRVFDRFWLRYSAWENETDAITERHRLFMELDDETSAPDSDDPDAETDGEVHVAFSAKEVLAETDFAALSDAEIEEVYRLISQLRVGGSQRLSRRMGRRSGGPYVDLRRTLADSFRYGGELVHLARAQRLHRPRRMVMLLDISGSMQPYARAFVRFAHAITASRRDVEVFALGTRLSRLTKTLRSLDPRVATIEAMTAAYDWGGGTRLGTSVQHFNDRWGARGVARGATVVILSDGWERDEPTLLAAQMSRLSLASSELIWVNPLKASPGYEPLAAGMAAALPYIDHFVEGHSFRSLSDLAQLLSDIQN